MASPLGSACRAVWQRFSSSDRYLHRNRDFEPIMAIAGPTVGRSGPPSPPRSEEHTSELQSRRDLVCRLLLEKKKTTAANVLPLSPTQPTSSTPTPSVD